MAIYNYGRIDWSMSQDSDGHRSYRIKWLIEDDTAADGPATVLTNSTTPVIGSPWAYGGDNDPWAFCTPQLTIQPLVDRDPSKYWIIENNFTTKPLNRCQSTDVGSPLLEPDRISGSFAQYVQAITKDRNDNPIKNSAHQLLTGPLVEFEHSLPNVTISKNLATLPLSTFAPMICKTVNDAPLWGLPARCVRLSNATWERKWYEVCTLYYVVTYEFDINYDTFDRVALDEGTKVLAPGGNPNNPNHFVAYKDDNGENTKILLNGLGAPLTNIATPVEIPIEYYKNENYLTLGIPASL